LRRVAACRLRNRVPPWTSGELA